MSRLVIFEIYFYEAVQQFLQITKAFVCVQTSTDWESFLKAFWQISFLRRALSSLSQFVQLFTANVLLYIYASIVQNIAALKLREHL